MDSSWLNDFKVPFSKGGSPQSHGQNAQQIDPERISDPSTSIIPSVDDRKAFLGCLAAVLASRYDYDIKVVSEPEGDHSEGATTEVHPNDQELLKSVFESIVVVTDPDANTSSDTTTNTSTATPPPTSTNGNPPLPPNSNTANNGTEGTPPRRRLFRRNTTSKNGSSVKSESNPSVLTSHSSSLSGGGGGGGQPSTKSERNAIIQRERHRRRRHQILSELLTNGRKLLRLDDENFNDDLLHMLDRLLIPIEKKSTTTTTATSDGDLIEGTLKLDDLSAQEMIPDPKDDIKKKRQDVLNTKLDEIEFIRTYWMWSNTTTETDKKTLSNAGVRCLSMFLMELLLVSETGYDARVRHSLKTLGVLLFLQDAIDNSNVNDGNVSEENQHRDKQIEQMDVIQYATLQFEALERTIANRLLELSKVNTNTGNANELQSTGTGQTNRRKIATALKVGGAAVAAGVVFAMTAGIAAPAIAAGVAAVTASGGILTASAVAIITSHVAVSTIFGVGGGSLAAYRVNRRVCGLTEFEIINEQQSNNNSSSSSSNIDTANKKSVFNKKNSNRDSFWKKNTSNNNTTSSGGATADDDDGEQNQTASNTTAATVPELYSTVCISGWIHDERDFQRPWGVTPTRPPIQDKLELLQRFYAIYDPSKIVSAAKIYNQYVPPTSIAANNGMKPTSKRVGSIKQGMNHNKKTKWYHFCIDCQLEYGSDPDHLFPLKDDRNDLKTIAQLTTQQVQTVETLFTELGYPAPVGTTTTTTMSSSSAYGNHHRQSFTSSTTSSSMNTYSSKETNNSNEISLIDTTWSNTNPSSSTTTTALSMSDMYALNELNEKQQQQQQTEDLIVIDPPTTEDGTNLPNNSLTEDLNTTNADNLPRHISTVWDYKSRYSGELYTLKWETRLLRQVKHSTLQLAFDVVSSSSKEILKFTVLSTLVVALTVPYLLSSATALISGPWTLAINRADEAGKQLARSLLISNAGNRPVTLIGYSFGARVIYSCLKELAKYQIQWEDDRVPTLDSKRSSKAKLSRSNSTSSNDNSVDDEMNNIGTGGGSASTTAGSASVNTTPPLDAIELIREPASIVEDVIILGLPDRLDISRLESCRQVVSGRFVHGYSQKDWVLSLMFNVQTVNLKPVCGTIPLPVPGIENVDLTDLLIGHQDYLYKIGPILEHVRHCQPFRYTPAGPSNNTGPNDTTTTTKVPCTDGPSDNIDKTDSPFDGVESAGIIQNDPFLQSGTPDDSLNNETNNEDVMYMEVMAKYNNEYNNNNNHTGIRGNYPDFLS